MKNINIYIAVIGLIFWAGISGCGVASFYRKGVQCFQKHEYTEAIKWFEKSNETGEKKPLTAYFLGVSYERINNHEKSIFWLTSALNLPEETEVKRDVIESLLKTARINRAIEIGVAGNITEAENQLIEITGSEYRFYMGKMFVQRKEFSSALQQYYASFLLTNKQTDNTYIANLWAAIGDAWYQKFESEGQEGDYYQACFSYRLAVALNHPVPEARKAIAARYMDIARQPLFKKYQPVIDSFNKIGRYRETKNIQGVIEEAQNIINISPVSDDRFFGWYIIGRAYYEQKNYLQALEYFKQAKEYSESKQYLIPADLYELLDKIYAEYSESQKIKE